ncbi:MAG: rhomboid family intramembrane serine protease [Fibrobacteres bacterium]|nr:rhomboid family intramembrane serine protease [Fibrobacterota bacterium]
MKNNAVTGIIAVSVILFLLSLFSSPVKFALAIVPSIDLSLAYRLLLYGFMHDGWMHLIMNMLALFFIAKPVENILGTKSFLKLYLISVYFSGIITVLISFLIPHTSAVVVGASGALCSILFVFWRMNPDARLLLFFVIPVNIRTAMIGLIAFDIVCMVSPLFKTGLAHSTHLGGYLCGWLYIAHSERIAIFFASFSRMLDERRARREQSRREDRKRIFIEEVDPILKKISENGIDSISDIEKAILKRAGKLK